MAIYQPNLTHQITGNTSGATANIGTGTYQLAGGNNITLSQNANSVTISGPSLAAYLTTAMQSGASTQFVQANAGFAGTNASGTIASNGISVSVNSAAAGVGIAAGTRTATTANTLLFDNANGVTFGLNAVGGSIMTASHNALTTARASTDAIGLNTAQTNVTWTANSAGLSLNASGYAGTATATTGNISVTLNSGGLSLNAPAFLTTAAQSSASNVSGVVVGTASNAATNQTAQLSGNVSFANGSGVSFFSTVSGATSGVAASVKTDYQSSNANYLTSQSNQAASNSAGSFTFQTLNFSNANNVTFGTSAGGIITASVAATIASNTPAVSNSAGSFTFSTLNFSNANNVTFGTSAGGIVTASVAAPGGGGVGIVAGTRTATTAGSLLFDNANGITFGLNGNGSSIMTASHNAITTGALSDHSHGNPTLALTNLTGTTASASNGFTLSLSANAPGAAAENNWVHALGANTAGNTTASGSTIGYSGINLTISGTNGSVMNLSAPATSSLSATGQVSISTNGSTISIGVPSEVTVSRYNEYKEAPLVAGQIGNGSLHIQPWIIPNLQFDRVVIHKAFSNATNSSFSFTVSDWVGIYTQNVSTLSLLYSTSGNTNFSGSGTVGSYLSYGGGIKARTLGLTQTLTAGMYWIGVIQSTTTGGGAGHTLDQALNSNMNSSYRGIMGAATNATNAMSLGFGVYTAATNSMPNSIAFTQINGNSSVFLRPPSIYFVSGTI